MAVLSEGDRAALSQDVNRDPPTIQGLAITRAQLRAAIDAIDDWVDANVTAFNQAIPQPARSALTARQKASLLLYIVRRRWEVS